MDVDFEKEKINKLNRYIKILGKVNGYNLSWSIEQENKFMKILNNCELDTNLDVREMFFDYAFDSHCTYKQALHYLINDLKDDKNDIISSIDEYEIFG